MIIIGGRFTDKSTMLTVLAMMVASIICYLLNYNKFRDIKKTVLLTSGLGGVINAIGGLAAVVAFGTVVQNTDAFQRIVDWLLNLNMNPYVEGVFSTAVISGVAGSSSGGLRITLQTLGEHFIASGCNFLFVYRLKTRP